jgi:hypothetical protein
MNTPTEQTNRDHPKSSCRPIPPPAWPPLCLTGQQVARELGISERQFSRIRHRLIARGLRPVKIGSSLGPGRPTVNYLRSSLERIVERAAEREDEL